LIHYFSFLFSGNNTSKSDDQVTIDTELSMNRYEDIQKAVAMCQNQSFVCSICRTSFRSMIFLQKHMTIVHQLQEPPIGVIQCTYCNFNCLNERELKEHCDQMHRFVCLICKKAFSSHSGYYSHNRIHHGHVEDLHVCQICNKKFECVSRLKIHERSHSKSRTFTCLVCNKSYKHKYSLDSHSCTIVSDS